MRTITRQKRKRLNSLSENVKAVYEQVCVNSSLLVPTNYTQEYERFISSDSYNPQFHYPRQSLTPINDLLNHLWHELLNIKLPLDLETYIESLLHHFVKLYHVRENIGTDKFAEHSKHLYPFHPIIIADVRNTFPKLSFADSSDAPIMNAYDIQEYAQRYIASNKHLGKIDVCIDQFNKYTIRAGVGKLIIGSGVTRNEQNVVRIMVHEIESHLLQKQNVYSGSPTLLLRTQYDREMYAEGMAIYNEIITGTITKSAYDLYSYRLEAVLMIDKSFREIFNMLLQHMVKNKAYMTAFRVKRGMKDTSKPGGWPKDAAYLLGYKAVSDYLHVGGRIELLYMTQVPELGELLIKHNLLPEKNYHMPEFHTIKG